MYVFQHQRTTNDANGIPRRLWRVWAIGENECETGYARTVAVVDEGYGDFPRDRWPGAVELSSVNIVGPEYTRTIRSAREAKFLEYR